MQVVYNLYQGLFPIQACALRYLLGISLCPMSLEASGLEDYHQAAMAEGSLGHKVDSLYLVEKPETLVRL